MNCPHCQTPIDEHPANRCLDALIAEKVMGWYQSPLGNWPWQMSPPEGSTGRAEGRVYNVPHYSKSIQDAWEIVEKFMENGSWDIEIAYNGYHWFCGMTTKQVVDDGREMAENAPLAICRSALKAVANV